jgi:microcystin-dependent protein
MEIIDYMIFIIGLILVYLIYKTRNLENLETFNTFNALNDTINNQYSSDINHIINLSTKLKNIMKNNDSFNINGNTISMKNLTIKKNLKFTNKNTNFQDLFPQYMIVAWASNNIPRGWALCDGNWWIINSDTNDVDMSTQNIGIQTPDLRGRFVLSSGKGNNLTERNINDKGGFEFHTLLPTELPPHKHDMYCVNIANNDNNYIYYNGIPGSGWAYIVATNTANATSDDIPYGNTDGTTAPHNNMPPYYVLTYIMKL